MHTFLHNQERWANRSQPREVRKDQNRYTTTKKTREANEVFCDLTTIMALGKPRLSREAVYWGSRAGRKKGRTEMSQKV